MYAYLYSKAGCLFILQNQLQDLKHLQLRLIQDQKNRSQYPETTNQKRFQDPLMINIPSMKVKAVKDYQLNNTLTQFDHT